MPDYAMQINRGQWADAEATAALVQAQAKFRPTHRHG